LRWTFSCWIQNGLTVLPNVNLVSNIGFDGDATHTTSRDNANSKIPVFNLSFPLKHPSWMIRDKRADSCTQKTNFNQPNVFIELLEGCTGWCLKNFGWLLLQSYKDFFLKYEY